MPDIEFAKSTDVTAESSVIGSVILDGSVLVVVQEIIKNKDYFFIPEYQNIWQAVCQLHKEGKKVTDWVLVRDQLIKMGLLEASGGVTELVDAAFNTPTAGNAVLYAGIVRECYLRRKLKKNSQKIGCMCSDSTLKIEDLFERSQKMLRESYEEDVNTKQYSMLGDALGNAGSASVDSYITTGFDNLDSMIYGLGKGHLTIIGARPGHGKTSMVCEMALRIVENSCKAVAIFSLEQTKKDMADRFLFNRAEIESQKCYRRWMTDDMLKVEKEQKAVLSNYPIVLDETRYLTLEVMRRRIYQFIELKKVEVIMVDYLQLLHVDNPKNKSRYEIVSDISSTLKTLAMEFNIPMVAACQLNRAVEGRDDKRPKLADLRESGNLEQDADVVLMLYHPAMYGVRNNAGYLVSQKKADEYIDEYELQVLIEKNRRGRTGMVAMDWKKENGRITEIGGSQNDLA